MSNYEIEPPSHRHVFFYKAETQFACEILYVNKEYVVCVCIARDLIIYKSGNHSKEK